MNQLSKPWPQRYIPFSTHEDRHVSLPYDPDYVSLAQGLLQMSEDEREELLFAVRTEYDISLIRHLMHLERVRATVKAMQ